MKNYQKEINQLQREQGLLGRQIYEIKEELEKEVNEYIDYLKLLYPENHIKLANEFWKVQNYEYPTIRFYFDYDTNWYYPNNKSTFIDFKFCLIGDIKVDVSWIDLAQKQRVPTFDYKVRSKVKIEKLLNDWILFGAKKTNEIPQV
jgi:hypothetical protein